MYMQKNSVSMAEVLPESRFLKPMTLEDFMKDIEISEQQFADGKFQSAMEFLTELRQEYGI